MSAPKEGQEPGPTPDAAPLPAGRASVLVADDVEALRKLIKRILEWDGRYEVVGEARDGEEAVALADKLKPDLVILDLMMPRKSGAQALIEIRDRSPSSAILVFSGSSADRFFEEFKPDGILRKGASPTEIRDMVERRSTENAGSHRDFGLQGLGFQPKFDVGTS